MTADGVTKQAHEACQEALALGLRGEADEAFAILENLIESADVSHQDADELVRELAEAVYLVARWTGEGGRGQRGLERLIGLAKSPTTRGWITLRLTLIARPANAAEMLQSALGDFAVAGDDAGRAMSMISLAFPEGDLLPSVEFRLAMVAAAHDAGKRLGDQVVQARAGNARATLLTYAGDTEGAIAAYREVWETFHLGSAQLSTEAAQAALNHALTLLSWGEYDEVNDVLARSQHIVTGPRTRDWYNLTRATAMLHHGRFRDALAGLKQIEGKRKDVAAFVAVLRVAAQVQVSPSMPKTDLDSECQLLQSLSMQLGCLARMTQAELRAARGEPNPHRDLVSTLRSLVPSRPRFGWDGVALVLAELAPKVAAEALEDMWDFWPAGARPMLRRQLVEALLGCCEPYPRFVAVAEGFASRGEPLSAARAWEHAARSAPTGRLSMAAHRMAMETYASTDAERSLSALLRERRIRRERGAPTIPTSQRYSVNSGLTPREREVSELAAQGLTAREIAEQLSLSLGTVRNHLQHARDKLGGIPKRALAKFADPF